MKSITKDWLLSAESDLLIIAQIKDIPELTHQLSFHAQQAIEKSFKAVVEENQMGFIKTHSLETLWGKVESKINLEIDQDTLLLLDQLYIDARYPGELGLLPNGAPTKNEAEKFNLLAQYVFKTISEYLAS